MAHRTSPPRPADVAARLDADVARAIDPEDPDHRRLRDLERAHAAAIARIRADDRADPNPEETEGMDEHKGYPTRRSTRFEQPETLLRSPPRITDRARRPDLDVPPASCPAGSVAVVAHCRKAGPRARRPAPGCSTPATLRARAAQVDAEVARLAAAQETTGAAYALALEAGDYPAVEALEATHDRQAADLLGVRAERDALAQVLTVVDGLPPGRCLDADSIVAQLRRQARRGEAARRDQVREAFALYQARRTQAKGILDQLRGDRGVGDLRTLDVYRELEATTKRKLAPRHAGAGEEVDVSAFLPELARSWGLGADVEQAGETGSAQDASHVLAQVLAPWIEPARSLDDFIEPAGPEYVRELDRLRGELRRVLGIEIPDQARGG